MVTSSSCAVYSMGDGSRQRFFSFGGGKKIIKIYLVALVGQFRLFSRDFDDILIQISKLFRMSEEKIKKSLNVNFFFSSGTILVRRRICRPWPNFKWAF